MILVINIFELLKILNSLKFKNIILPKVNQEL